MPSPAPTTPIPSASPTMTLRPSADTPGPTVSNQPTGVPTRSSFGIRIVVSASASTGSTCSGYDFLGLKRYVELEFAATTGINKELLDVQCDDRSNSTSNASSAVNSSEARQLTQSQLFLVCDTDLPSENFIDRSLNDTLMSVVNVMELNLDKLAGNGTLATNLKAAIFADITSYPTSTPSSLPTGSPTAMPTSRPSPVPLPKPSIAPMPEPSLLPTYAPSYVPSPAPSPAPSSAPSSAPSLVPTSRPSPIPCGNELEPTVCQSFVALDSSRCVSSLGNLCAATCGLCGFAMTAAPTVARCVDVIGSDLCNAYLESNPGDCVSNLQGVCDVSCGHCNATHARRRLGNQSDVVSEQLALRSQMIEWIDSVSFEGATVDVLATLVPTRLPTTTTSAPSKSAKDQKDLAEQLLTKYRRVIFLTAIAFIGCCCSLGPVCYLRMHLKARRRRVHIEIVRAKMNAAQQESNDRSSAENSLAVALSSRSRPVRVWPSPQDSGAVVEVRPAEPPTVAPMQFHSRAMRLAAVQHIARGGRIAPAEFAASVRPQRGLARVHVEPPNVADSNESEVGSKSDEVQTATNPSPPSTASSDDSRRRTSRRRSYGDEAQIFPPGDIRDEDD